MASPQLLWQCVKKGSAYLVKGRSGDRPIFSKEAGNLANKHSYKYSGAFCLSLFLVWVRQREGAAVCLCERGGAPVCLCVLAVEGGRRSTMARRMTGGAAHKRSHSGGGRRVLNPYLSLLSPSLLPFPLSGLVNPATVDIALVPEGIKVTTSRPKNVNKPKAFKASSISKKGACRAAAAASKVAASARPDLKRAAAARASAVARAQRSIKAAAKAAA